MTERDALAAEIFPERWAIAQALKGKRGRNMRCKVRNQAEHERDMRPLRAAGRNCASCRSFQKGPPGINGMTCAAESDFRGYTLATADGLCPMWKPATPA